MEYIQSTTYEKINPMTVPAKVAEYIADGKQIISIIPVQGGFIFCFGPDAP